MYLMLLMHWMQHKQSMQQRFTFCACILFALIAAATAGVSKQAHHFGNCLTVISMIGHVSICHVAIMQKCFRHLHHMQAA